MAHNEHAGLLKGYLQDVCDQLDHETLVRPWRQWAKSLLSVPVAVGLSLAVTQCGGSSSSAPEEECSGDSCAELCGDELDNDADGDTDCADDEDGDRSIDCANLDCANDPSCNGAVPLYAVPF
jgi:hypothetical protein